MEEFIHYPVFHREIIDHFQSIPTKDFTYFMDCTAGEGGHSEKILNSFPGSKLIFMDRDPIMLDRAGKRLENFRERSFSLNENFSKINHEQIKELLGVESVDGILIDLGISTFHLVHSNRGFSFKKDEYLDMRLDETNKLDAFYIVNHYKAENLLKIFREYGEENWSIKIVERIVDIRRKNPIKTTFELAKCVESSIPRKFWPPHSHPSFRIFQAIRIEVNKELDHIEKGIEKLVSFLNPNGIMCVISFHSLEDRIVKNSFKKLAMEKKIQIITKKPIVPGDLELKENNASRSAKLRIIQKI